ncbi:Hypothetical predicted protein [Paramuricea clavata]|uniref:Reverse transcriptase domain-containing protein n=1 Tax=Paramuricea clavata TaxID=317549 RepID=A0A7D9J8U5_PARCT|nr:Hypothetical predicted protein [Paramuricea clavata]
MKYSGTFLLKFKSYQCLNNDIWQRIGYLGIRKKYRGERSGKNKHRIAVRITSRNTRLLDHGNRRFHNPSNCVIPKLLNCDKTYDLPNFLVLNARSIAGKVDELRWVDDQYEFQVICITETWLCEEIPNEIIGLSDYDIIRCDRTGKKGDGVAVYVHRNLPYRIRRDLSSISVDSVISRLRIIKHSKAALKILKEAADLIGPILCDIIHHSFCSKEFPANWKIYDICPIPKIIPLPSVEDLRPIALTSILSKIQESFAVEWMTQDVLPNVTPSQYGGLAGSSTTLALLNLLHNWYQALDQPHTRIRVLFLDFAKAFDLINHNKLLHDMQRMGVREALIPWIASYLKGREESK